MMKDLTLKRGKASSTVSLVLSAYFCVLIIHQITIAFPSDSGIAHLITRAMHMPILLLLLIPIDIPPNHVTSVINYKVKSLTVTSLLCAWAGDILVVYNAQADHFFMIGVSAFLLSHCFFAWALLLTNNGENRWPVLKKNGWILAVSAIVSFGLLIYLKDELGEVFGSGMGYIFSLLVMLLATLLSKPSDNDRSYRLALFGALLFLTSDVLLTLNKFYTPILYGEFLTSATYVIAQLLLVWSIRLHLTKE